MTLNSHVISEMQASELLANFVSPGQFLIFCDGGLANRINSMISGMVLAERLGRSFRILWPLNNRCEASFDDLFDMRCFVGEHRLIDLVPLSANLILWLHENDVGFAGNIQRLRDLKPVEASQLLESSIGENKTILFSENSILSWLPEEDIRRHVRDLSFHAEFRYQARQILVDKGLYNKSCYISVHLRGTDFPQRTPIEEAKNLVKKHTEDIFFICSDEKKIESELSCFPNVFINNKRSFVEKMADGPWRFQTKDSDGLPYTSNINRDRDSVKEAVVDLILLAFGRPLATSASSFLGLANLLRKSGWIEDLFGYVNSPQTFAYETRAFLRLLKPKTLKNDHKVRIGANADGGYVLPSRALSTSVVVSIGIGDQVSFDLALANRGATVYQFDHTIEQQPLQHKNFRYQRKGWGPITSGDFLSLSSMISDIDWGQEKHPILKFDVEGAEWGALQSANQEDLDRFDIIVGEFHYFHNLISRDFHELVYSIFKKLSFSYAPIHIHPNNATGVRLINGIPIPPLLEITWCKKAMVNDNGFCRDPIPGPLDFPNMKDRPDIFMSLF